MSATARPLVVELVTEELPPKALEALGLSFAEGIRGVLLERKLITPAAPWHAYATPRRLAVEIEAVLARAADQPFAEKLMPAAIGLDAAGAATPALLKKLKARGLGHLDATTLVHRNDGRQEMLYAEGTAPGVTLAKGLQEALDHAIAHLPIPKVMQYQLADGRTSVRFVRPAHRLLALWGEDIIPLQALGLQAGRLTQGHRFMSSGPITVADAGQWRAALRQANVIASFGDRRREIASQLARTAAGVGAAIGEGPEVEALLDEVTALVEYPTVYVGAFEQEFLSVPPECLILTMRLNQKYFPLFDPQTQRLTHQFLIVSNMRPQDPRHIIYGNQRVVRPRLADAQFFYQTDLKTRLADRVAGLEHSVYHNKLGSELERTQRVQALAGWLAPLLGGDAAAAGRAARLAHADLGTQMVGEFPELQGIMGAYYAAHDAEPADVVQALRDQYRTRLDAPVDAATLTSAVLYMAERAETLVGIWGIGLAPTGERDPYGLRRAALGLISAYEQLTAGGFLHANQDTAARLSALLGHAAAGFAPGTLADGTVAATLEFVYERYRNQLLAGHERSAIDAVLALWPPLHQVNARVLACEAFRELPEAEVLAAANKRVSNLLKKAEGSPQPFDAGLVVEVAERELAETIARLRTPCEAALAEGDFTASLALLAQARPAVDRFFTEVMVLADDPRLRANRLALLQSLHDLMNQVADLSRLAR